MSDDIIVSVDNIDSIIESHVIPAEENEIRPHDSKQISRLEVSPNRKYLVTYSENDHSIVGWDVKDIDDELKIDDETERLKSEITIKINNKYKNLSQICVSDNKKLVCIYVYND